MKKKLILLAIMITNMVFATTACGSNKDETVQNATNQNTTAGENASETITEEDISPENTTIEMVGNGDTGETTGNVATEMTPTVGILNDVWITYGEDEKFFAMGGDMNNPVDNAPGAFSLEDVESLSAMLYIPADSVALVDEAASLIHAMNANTFTGAAFHLTDEGNAKTLAASLKENILNTQWMCGFPDKLVIFQINDAYVVSAFGNADVMENFKHKVTEVYGENAVILVEENIQ